MNDLLPNPAKTTALAQVTLGFFLLALVLFGGRVAAATVVDEMTLHEPDIPVEHIEPLSAEEVAELVAPIALYPDDLLSIVLPASTYPLYIVQAARFLEARKDDENLEPPEAWDDSIIALLNYPEALELMNSDLDWTWKLGEAVLKQQGDVIDAIGDFRERARLAGNLESDEYQIVDELDDGTIEITPANPELIYVPYYEPSSVTAYSPWPVYHYYPRAYPVYYYPYPAGHAFPSGRFWGVTSAFSIGWSTHRLHLHHYRRPIYRHHAGNYWYPHRYRQGASPRHRPPYRRPPNRHDGDRSGFDRHERQRKYRAGRNGLPGARMTRKGTRADGPRRDNQRIERIDRRSSDAQNQGLARRAPVQQPRAQHPRRQPRRAIRTAAVQPPREQQPAQHQARMSLARSQPQSVAVAPERRGHSKNRSSRTPNKKGVTTNAVRAQRSRRTTGFRRNQ